MINGRFRKGHNPPYRREPAFGGFMGNYNPFPEYNYGPPPAKLPNDGPDVMTLMHAIVKNNFMKLPIPEFLCGDLRVNHSGMVVRLTGRLIKKRVSRFVELRDWSNGACQLVINEDNHRVANRLQNMAENTVLSIIGTVMRRPKNSCNFSMPTGEIEVEVNEIIHTSYPYPNRRLGSKRNYSTMAEQHTCGITSIEYKMSKSENILKYFEYRELTCNDLRRADIGKTVTLVGWIPYTKNCKFMQLKDGYGHTQIVVEDEALQDTCLSAPEQTVVQVTGKVFGRPKANVNMKYETGEIEVLVSSVKILNPEEPYDGPIRNRTKVQKMTIEDLEEDNDDIPSTSQASERMIQDKNETSSEMSRADGVCTPTMTSMAASMGSSGLVKVADTNKFTCRTHNCNELSALNIGQKVVLCGWLHFQRMNRFLILRDGYGQTQVLLNEKTQGLEEYENEQLPYESILRIEGTVIPRPSAMIKEDMKTGMIEVSAEKIEVLNMAKRSLPFEVRKFNRAGERLRLMHRYLDLRFFEMQHNLRARSEMIMKMREYLIKYLGFVEVETPTLFRSTPGGAQEFVVPTRKKGHFYSLVQSPQQFKQILMSGAIDRYFQVARCYRDEATRPDRQPEFTQLDVELSFTSREDILQLIEELIRYSWPKDLPKIQIPFRRMTYEEAMDMYGCDKPDTRFGLVLNNVSDICAKNESLKNKYREFGAYGFIVRSQEVLWSTSDRKQYDILAREFSGNLFIRKIVNYKDSLERLASLVGEDIAREVFNKFVVEESDLLFLAIGNKKDAQTMMGRIRVDYNNALIENNRVAKNNAFKFVWVLDFPLFEYNNDNGKIESVHHPFTAPHPDDMDKFNSARDKELLRVRSQAYDLVLNGQEVGGGSIRIHDRDTQHYVLEQLLKIPHEHLEHLLNALESGCPPHGGIALGLDRYISILRRTRSIRDVIAFPKSLNGRDPLSNAPIPISDEEKKLYHLEIVDFKETPFEDKEAAANMDHLDNMDNISIASSLVSLSSSHSETSHELDSDLDCFLLGDSDDEVLMKRNSPPNPKPTAEPKRKSPDWKESKAANNSEPLDIKPVITEPVDIKVPVPVPAPAPAPVSVPEATPTPSTSSSKVSQKSSGTPHKRSSKKKHQQNNSSTKTST